MRHALVTVHLIDKARSANAPAARRAPARRRPTRPPAARRPRPRRLATLVRRTRTQVVRPT